MRKWEASLLIPNKPLIQLLLPLYDPEKESKKLNTCPEFGYLIGWGNRNPIHYIQKVRVNLPGLGKKRVCTSIGQGAIMKDIRIPRRLFIRSILKGLTHLALNLFSDFELIGEENIPDQGPIIITGNHFSFADSVALLRIAPPSLEVFTGANPAFTPGWAKLLPRLWGVLYVYRGTGSRQAIRDAENVLRQGGFFGIFPEGGAWAEMIRPARPGAAYLAAKTDSQILPVAFTGFRDVFPLRLRNKNKVTIRVGKPYGPVSVSGRGQEKRQQLDELGDRIMQEIADLLPDHLRGRYSSDPAVREKAKEVESYPWETAYWDEV
jgi:1-acyl-sn-glycerol-3-phosphate acyltransferase